MCIRISIEIILKFISHSHIVLTILNREALLYDVDNEHNTEWLVRISARLLSILASSFFLTHTQTQIHNANLCLSKIAITKCHRTGREYDFNALFFFWKMPRSAADM